jgi:diguanylate cyclase (GGDEF)-like protein/PAS domain S-box-containing protein
MTGKLCFLCCQNFHPEVAAAIAAEGWTDVSVCPFTSRCGHPPLSWNELRPLVETDCTQLVILGRSCLEGLGRPPADWPPVRQLQQQECFDLVAGPALAAEAIARDAYLLTPGWLADWRGNLGKMGFDEGNAAEFFHDFAHELLLLDTGVDLDAPRRLAEFAGAVALPASRLTVGIDYLRQLLGRLVAEWRLGEEQQQAHERERNYARELADHKSAMDLLGRMTLLKEERDTITAIEELFQMLFAPQEFHYVRFDNGSMTRAADALPPDLSRQIRALTGDWAWTDSQTGFLLRIAMSGETLGVVIADRFLFPEYRESYLNLALSVAGVVGLAIDNTRTYRRIKKTEEALRKSERSLKLAQAMAHLGHWELNVGSGDTHWSDETYRILGYDPGKLVPSYAAFLQAIHPEDRKLVEKYIQAAHAGGSFDIEFKIVLPDGRTRVLHGMGEVILMGTDQQPQIIGAIRDITAPEHTELLGVVQDITEQKELQWKLERQSRTDPLTGCANRRHFLELAEHELARARRYTEEVSVLMLDLDHFKEINDRYGHQAGDLTLRRLVQVCQATLRAEDTVGRLGGEEFAILLPESARNKALEVAERLCRAIASAEVPLEGKAPLRFTTSIGVATLAQEDSDISLVLGRADKALYEAKSAGRNRVVVA